MNNTTTTREVPVNFYYVFPILTLCVFIAVALVGNIIILVIFFMTKELQTVVNYFLASLALADLLTAIFPMPLWLSYKIHNRWLFSLSLLQAWRCADLAFCTASIWNLCAISVDRCIAISRPFLHRSWQTSFRMKCALALVWGYSLVMAVFITDSVKWRGRGLLISSASYYIPTVIIIAAYLTIYTSQIKSREDLIAQDVSTRIRSKQDMRIAKYMLLLIASFIICWMGHFVMGTIFTFAKPKIHLFIKDCIKAMSYLNSAINPFLYGYVSPKFRVAFKKIIRCRGRGHMPTRRAWKQMSPTRSTPSRQTSSSKIVDKMDNIGSREDAV